jgi:large subunit ribosomal protein L17
MRHRKRGRKLSRTASHRKAMVRNLTISLFEHGRVTTTPAKAKETRPFAERLITMAKDGSLAARRRALAALNDKRIVKHLFEEIGPRYRERPGGYCRILHLDRGRLGDGGDLCLFELVEEEIKRKGGKERARVKAAVSESAGEGEAETAETAAAATEPAGDEESGDAKEE